ncbi:nucleotidyl transferase [Erythrobacter longus]|uniref:Nucleotidyl transferase n=1 Tax=Erythrobacter longus TaxID=1044 RepID=A0A074MBQ8_ERYLO|nr:NTP transferase domain-containing protein [Erythrobacter longus]KEO92221.1 nucleotidyl transferase [Erythrobacter longus]
MDGLILAAGFGSRLRDLFASKPLAEVNGVTLLEIAVRQLASAGAGKDGGRIVVVTGYQADAVEAAVADLRARMELEIITTRVDDWEKPNGHSVLAGAKLLRANYLLVMCDHILSSAILRGLAGAGHSQHGVTLAIDRQTVSPLIDPDDATWVQTRGACLIERIGKGLEAYDAVDCGAFLATPALAEAIVEAIDQGKPGSLSDGMQMLADRGAAATHDIGDAWWMDVDDPKAHRMAQDLLDERFSLLGNDAAWGHRLEAGVNA